MQTQKLTINNIPALLWGEKSDKLYIHIHGKMSCKEHAKDFAQIAKNKAFQTLSFDLAGHGERINEGKDPSNACDIFNAMYDLDKIADYAFANWKDISLFACSIGAFFSLHTYAKKNFTKCLFQAPILNMEYLIKQMFIWFNITEERLQAEQEIYTPIETLRWDYYQYVLKHSNIQWQIPTSILYGGQDNLQALEIIQSFADKYNCKLTISQNSEHAFMGIEDTQIVHNWLRENI